MILVLHNMIPSNVKKRKKKKKKKEPPNVTKKTIKCDVGTTQCEDEIIKYEKKLKKPPNVRK